MSSSCPALVTETVPEARSNKRLVAKPEGECGGSALYVAYMNPNSPEQILFHPSHTPDPYSFRAGNQLPLCLRAFCVLCGKA